MQIPSPKKTKQVSIMLPPRALEANQLTSMAPSPMSRPTVTPQNAASTQWRTVVCPHPPMKHCFRRPSTIDTMDTDSSSGGLCTPANLWPTPNGTPMGTPTATATPKILGFGELTLAPKQLPPQSPSAFTRAITMAEAQNLQWATRLQTITDISPKKKMTAAGYPVAARGACDMDVSMEATEDMETPSPDKNRRMLMQASPMQFQSSLGPATPEEKPFMMHRSEQFRCV